MAMKNNIFFLFVILSVASCDTMPEPEVEPLTLSQYIIGQWEFKIYETGVEYYYFTFASGSYTIEYFDGEKTLKSDSPGYVLNEETNEVDLFKATIKDYEKNRIYYLDWPVCYVEMTNDNTMTWQDQTGIVYIFNRLNQL